MSLSSRTLPPRHWPEPDDGCSRCADLEDELRRIKADRDELLGRIRDLERAAPTSRSSRSGTTGSFPYGLVDVEEQPPPPAARASMTVPSARRSARDEIVPTPVGYASPGAAEVKRAGQGIDVGAISKLSPEALDDLPYGLLTVDAEGSVVFYNDTESRLAGFPKDRVLGRNFFREVAPCTQVREFEGRFHELVRDPVGVRVQSFDFVFAFDHSEQHVSIVMTPARRRGHFHLAFIRRAILPR